MQKKFEDRFSQKVVYREDRGEGVAAGQSTSYGSKWTNEL